MISMVKHCVWYLGCYLRGTRGVAAMEYAIIVGVVVVGIGTAVALFQDEVTGLINDVTTDLDARRTAINTDQNSVGN